ncbi:hypothetical protein KBX14_08010 [Corynebacterium sp. CCUG 61414]|uniref:beta family protein n=1 Tax=Corynebacterium sp. CCUG 61414 TaxID=2823896 RepID=UPI00210E51BA|nr:beta family protein [Corynebacterium sp. CCUG 61414]MCQ4610362.1 hypothetical protein [Corynebacterium sp. CCUG 61414]
MRAFNEKHYVPALFTKRAELTALSKLDIGLKSDISPLFVIPPLEIDHETGEQRKSTDRHIENVATELTQKWGKNPAFIDTQYLEDSMLANGEHPLQAIITEAKELELQLVPVVPDKPTAPLLKALTNLKPEEICLRVNISDWLDFKSEPLLEELGVEKDRVHLIIDRSDDQSDLARKITRTIVEQLQSPTEWKTVTVLGTSMPDPLPNDSLLFEVERTEVIDHDRFLNGEIQVPRKPSYGDYTITAPTPFTVVDPRLIQISAKFKYASDTAWVIARGDLFKGHGGRSKGASAFLPVAEKILRHPAFDNEPVGPDEWLRAAAADPSKGGSPEVWVRVGVWRHILKTIEHLM